MIGVKDGEVVFSDGEGNYTINAKHRRSEFLACGYRYIVSSGDYYCTTDNCSCCPEQQRNECVKSVLNNDFMMDNQIVSDETLLAFFNCIVFFDDRFREDIANAPTLEDRLEIIHGL